MLLLIWALTLTATVVIGNGNAETETAEEHEARVQREHADADAIQNRRIKAKTEAEYKRTYHPKTIKWFEKEYPDLIEGRKMKYDKLQWVQFKRFLGTRKVKKRKKYRQDSNSIYHLAGVSIPTEYGK